MGFAELEAKIEDESDDTTDDFEQLPTVQPSATTAISGELISLGFTGATDETQNISGLGGRGDFVVTLRQPTALLGSVWEALGREQAEDGIISNDDGSNYPFDVDRQWGPTKDFRVVDVPTDDSEFGRNVSDMAKRVDGSYEQVGVEVYGSEYPSKPVGDATGVDNPVDIPEDVVEVRLTGKAGRRIVQNLDAVDESAYVNEDGETSDGLIEYPENYQGDDYDARRGDDMFERTARFPALHPELEGEEIVVYLRYPSGSSEGGNYSPVFGEVLLNDADDVADMTMLSARENDGMFDERTDLIEDHWTYCDFPHNVDRLDLDDSETDTSDGDTSGDTDTDDDDGFDFNELDPSSGDDSTEVAVSMTDVEPVTQGFIEQAADTVAARDGDSPSDVFGDWESVVENAVESDEIPSEDGDAAMLSTLVEQEADKR